MAAIGANLVSLKGAGGAEGAVFEVFSRLPL
jgi:hypothetical protein